MEAVSEKNNKWQWWVLFTVIIGTFLGRLDGTIVNLAMPKMMDSFNVSLTTVGWIATSYIIANAVFVPIWGKLGDTLGQKKVYNIGLVIFILGSILSAFSWNFSSMIFFRIIQAIAASSNYPAAMSIIAYTFPDRKKRLQAMGIWSASFAAAAVFGPLLGGPLIDNFGWPSIFLINLPLGLIGLIMSMTFITETETTKSVSFDWWGSLTLGISLSTLILVLEKGLVWGWTSEKSLLTYLLTLIFSVIFYYIEKNHPEPVVDLKFFKNEIFVNTLVNNFVVFLGMMGSIFLIPVFASIFLGLNATQTGYLFMPMALFMMISSPIGGAISGKIEPRYIIFGSTLLSAIGLFAFAHLDVRSTVWDIIIPLSIFAFGMGIGMPQRTSIISNSVPQNEIGIASSILALARNIAGAFGIAIFNTILINTEKSNVIEIAKNSILNIPNTTNYGEFVGLITLKAQVTAYNKVFVIAAILVFIGAVLALRIKIPKDNKEF